MSRHLIIDRKPVNIAPDGSCVDFIAGLTIDADGSPRCYHPAGSPPGLDFTANGGHPGNWWGVATRPNGLPIIQGPRDPAPGFYVSTTALKHPGFRHGDPRREINSETVAFFVIPPQIIRAVPGIVLGCRGLVVDTLTGRNIPAVPADIGPTNHLGEGSMFLAGAFGLNNDPKRGGSHEARFHYFLWPDEPAPGFRLQPAGRALAMMDRPIIYQGELA